MKLNIYLLLILVGLSGCATSSNKALDKKVDAASAITNRASLESEAKKVIDNSENLTPLQKENLSALRSSTTAQVDVLQKQSLQLRSVLLKDLISSNYNAKEVDLIKKRIRKLENQKLSVIFDATEKANIILGRQASENPYVMREFFGLGHSID